MESSVRDVMPAPPRLRVEAAAGSAFELLVGLYAATSPDAAHAPSWVPERARWSPDLVDAVARAGERSGEAWLHLLGLALELPSTDAPSFVEAVSRVAPREVRRHLVGVHAPAWVGMVGPDTLERMAAGDKRATEEALAHPRYYAGRAAESLGPLITKPARQTKERVVTALRLFAAEAFAPHEREAVAALRGGADEVTALARSLAPRDVIARVTPGYVYEPEPEFRRVVLVPHLAARPSLLLCQHRGDRVICFPLAAEHADPEASLDELADAVGLARSTAHHHLAQLRAAGLVELHGNARGYWYALRAEGIGEAERALAELAAPPAELPATRTRKRRRRARRAGTG